jgi:hypothetical protein
VFWLAELEAVSAGLLEHATSVSNRKTDSKYSARERIFYPPNQKFIEAKTVIEASAARKRNRTIRSSRELYARYIRAMLSVR